GVTPMNERAAIKKQIIARQASYRDTADEPTRKAIQTQVKALALALTAAGKQSSNPVERKASATASLLRQLHDSIMDKVEHMIAEKMAGALFFRGTWSADGEYGPGSLCQHGGTVWVSTVEKATTKPGTSSEWRMLVKTKGAN